MNKINKIGAILLFALCLPFCGGWTVATDSTPRYVGGELLSTYASETVTYVSKRVIADISTTNNTPEYSAVSGMQNGCGAVAGSIIVGFYDKYYANLIPDWNSYYSTGKYRTQDRVYVPNLMNELYTLMQTNVDAPGVSESEFKNGLKSYVNGKGYGLNYVSLGQGNSFDYNAFKAAVANNEVTALFIQPSNVYNIDTYDSRDIITSTNISGNHIMVAYGYYEVEYNLGNGTRVDKYLRVSTGMAEASMMYYKVGSYLDAAYVVKIN